MRSRVFADRNLKVMAAGQSVNMFGNTAMSIVLGIWVKNLTGSSAEAGIIFLLLAVTGFLAPVTGTVADRFPRRPLLIVNDALSAVIMGLLLFVEGKGSVWLIYLVTVLYSFSGQVYRAARGGLLHAMVPDDQLGAVNGFFGSLNQGLKVVGPLAGAGIYALWGGKIVVLADIGTFAVSIACYLALRGVDDAAGHSRRAGGKAPGRDMLAGVKHVFAVPVIRWMVLASAVAFTGAGMIDVAMFSLVSQGLHRPATLIGIMTSLEGAGSVAAGFAIAPMMRRFGEYTVACAGFLLNGAGLVLAATAVFDAVLAGSVLIGIGIPMVLVAQLTVVQRNSVGGLQGRVIAASEGIVYIPFSTAIAVAAGLIAMVGFQPIYLGVAAGFTVVGLAMAPYLKVTAPKPESDGDSAEAGATQEASAVTDSAEFSA